MKYYKLLTNNEFIGVVNSHNFVAENPTNGWLLTSNENLGQFVSYKNQLYRDYWMLPISSRVRQYTNVSIVEITQEEYETLQEAIDNNEPIIIDDDEPDEPINEDPIIEEPDVTIEFVRSSKIKEMSAACRTAIEAGFDLPLRDSEYHFSLGTQDQLNLMNLNIAAQTEELIPYHADGEECVFYTPEEIKQIISAATAHKNYLLAYYNALKSFINSLETMEDIAAIEYGVPIPDEYKSDVLRVLE